MPLYSIRQELLLDGAQNTLPEVNGRLGRVCTEFVIHQLRSKETRRN